MSRFDPYIHPDLPMPRPMMTLLNVLEQMEYSPLKFFWVGGKKIHWRFGYYMPAVISYRPGIEHRLAIDFSTAANRWGHGNRKRSLKCAEMGIQYLMLKRSDSAAEMMLKIRILVSKLREVTEYIPYERRTNATDPESGSETVTPGG